MTTDSNRAVTDLIGGLTSLSRDAAAMDAATVNIYRALLDDAVRAAALAQVERDDAIAKVDAADQRTRSLDAALTAERETSRGLVAQVDTWRDTWARVETIVDEAFGPFPVWPVYDTICAMERGIHDGIRAAQELAAIRDIVAPGNPQGTVVDAVRARLDAVENAQAFGIRERDAAIARAEKAESDLSELTITRDRLLAREHEDGRLHAQLRAEIAELRARPVLTEDLLRGALDAHGYAGLTRKLFAHLGPVTLPLAELRARPVLTVEALDEALIMASAAYYDRSRDDSLAWPHKRYAEHAVKSLGPVTLPSPDRAEELAATLVGTARASMTDVPIAWSCDFADGNENARRALTNVVRTALAKLSPAPAPTFDAAFLRRVLVATKHGPNGKGGPGPCDAACVKCEAELMAKAAPAREVAPTRVLVHADGGACHGSRVVDGRCVGCGIAPDMQSTSLWLDADARPVQCEPAKVVAPTLVAVSDEELAVAFYSEPERPALRECIDAADLAGIRAVRAKLGAAEVTEERLAAALTAEFPYVLVGKVNQCALAILARLRATAAKGG